MINFEEELKKFHPSLEIEEAEDKDDFNSSIDEFDRSPAVQLPNSDDEGEYIPEEEEEFEFSCGGNCSGCSVEGCGGIPEEETEE